MSTNQTLDPLIKQRKVAELRGCTPRWIYELVKREEFPPPDRPARRRGEPNLWKLSTVQRAVDDFIASANSPAQ
jgi:hypothetical protein